MIFVAATLVTGQCSLAVERLLRKQKVAGSIPVVGSSYELLCGAFSKTLFGAFLNGPVAQWIRHRSTEPEIVGSSPTRVMCCCFLLYFSFLGLVFTGSYIVARTLWPSG